MVACMSNNLKSMGLLGMPASCDMGGAIDFSRDFLFHPCLLVRPCQMKMNLKILGGRTGVGQPRAAARVQYPAHPGRELCIGANGKKFW